MTRSFRFQKYLRSMLRPGAVVGLAALVLLMCGTAGAQLSGKGTVSGTVMDPTGAAIPGAAVKITNTETGVSVTTTSTSAGDYNVSTLDPGIYTVTVTAPGFEALTQKNVHVNAMESQTFNPKLTVGASDETVTVTTLPPALETSNATLGATMENEMYEALPIEMGAFNQPDQRRATDFALLMPGVQGNETNGNATTNTGVVNGSGSRGAASSVYIDGLPFTQVSGEGDPRFVWTAISVDSVEQFQVQTSGYSALYEGQGVQNYNVKHGTSKYHVGLYEFFRNTALDSWGFFKVKNPVTGNLQKPVEHQNEYGILLSGPLVPFGTWRDKVFFFANYNGFRYSHVQPGYITFPNAAEQAGNFQSLLTTNLTANNVGVFDPNTQANCTANSTTGPCRYRYGFVYGGTPGASGDPVLGPGGTSAVDIIPSSEFSPVAVKMQAMIPTLLNQSATNNYLAANSSQLSNWSQTYRIDYNVTQKDQLTFVAALGRQASSVPVGQTTAGRNTGPVPYNYGQAYAPKTAVGIIEETHTFTPHVVNQLKYGFARYNGPTINADFAPQYGASTFGITNLPAGQTAGAFPITTFAGTDGPTQWAGTTASRAIANSYALVDNVQWIFGKHSVTIGGELAWMEYQTLSASTSATPLTMALAVTETAGITPSTNAKPAYAAISGTGLSYASFLVGQIDKGSFTQYLIPEYGARFRPISPYVQDDWKVTSNLTLDLGIRYDFYPSFKEAHDYVSFFDPTLTNTATNSLGGLNFAGTGAGTCNCHTPVNNYFKNIGPRVGFAYQSDSKTVWRGSFGVMYTHGNGVGGAANSRTGTGTLGFSSAPSSTTSNMLAAFVLSPGNTAFPTYTAASGRASGVNYGTGNTTTAGYTGGPSSMGYADPYLGGRAPQYINWSFGFQHSWTDNFTSTISYVGSEGHFLVADGSNIRGYWSDSLDPQYLSLNTNLGLSGTALQTYCATNTACPATYKVLASGQTLATLLKPFPFQSVGDTYGNVANSIYHGLQVSLMKRAAHGTTFMLNYTWSRAIDDGGTFRTGYAIPAAYSNNGKSWAPDAIERTVSTSNQPHHLVFTGVEELPFGKGMLGGGHEWSRAVFGGFKFSQILQMYSGSPLAITAATCQTNPAQSTCEPMLNPGFSGSARQNGRWGNGSTYGNMLSYITPSTGTCTGSGATAPSGPFINPVSTCLNTPFAPAYTFGNAPRTQAYPGLTGPGNFGLDISLRRTFPLHFTDSARLSVQADMYNVTNYVLFSGIGVSLGSSSFGVPSTQGNVQRSAQLSARIEF